METSINIRSIESYLITEKGLEEPRFWESLYFGICVHS